MEAIQLKHNHITGIGMKVITNLVMIPLVRFTKNAPGSGKKLDKKFDKRSFFSKKFKKSGLNAHRDFIVVKMMEKIFSGYWYRFGRYKK